MPDWLEIALQTFTIFVLFIGLLGLIMPIFPGLVIMWLGTLVYALIQNGAGNMTGWDEFLFGLITVFMIIGNVADNLIIAPKMSDKYIQWRSILFAIATSILSLSAFT